MKRTYWIEKILNKLYAVRWHDGNLSHIAYEGTKDECIDWIERTTKEKYYENKEEAT